MSFFKNLLNKVLHEPAVVVGVVVAALNAATVQTWQGYASAVGVALLRFVVSPVIGEPKNEEAAK